MADTPFDPECIFCRIAAEEMEAAVIVETNDIIAILDAFPSSTGHSLVLPRAHHENLLTVPPELLAACAEASQHLARALQAALSPDGIAVTQFNGAAAGQTIFHYHQHVIPRWEGQDWRSHGKQKADLAEQHELAARIRDHMDW